LRAHHRHPPGHGRDPAVPHARLRARRALHGLGARQRGRGRRLAAGQPRHRSRLRGRRRGLRQELGRAAVLRQLGRGEGDPRPLPPLHRRRGQDGADQRRRVLALPAAAPQRQGHRRGDGLAALHRRRRGGEPAARAEGGDGVACGRRGMSRDIVLAFSGGLDTSFCVPWLQEQGWSVHTVFADTGGVGAAERAAIEARAAELGVASHRTVDGGPALWRDFVRPFVWAGEGYQGQYPLLVSDRYLIVDAVLARARELGTNAVAHGCTGMGNDQVRFDLAVMSTRSGTTGDWTIVAPIREIQKQHAQTRAYEQAYLEQRGFAVNAKQKAYTINENLLGVTLSGGEIDD